MTRSRILTVALVAVLALLAAAAWLLYGRTVSGGLEYADSDKYTVGGATVSDKVENLYVDWTAGKVNIEDHSGDGVIISEKANRTLNDDDSLRWWLDGTTLRLRYAKPGFRISYNLSKELTVSLPAGTVLKIADLSSTSADLEIPSLAADEIRLASTSGSISAVTVTGKLTASSTSGNIAIRQGTTIGTVDLNSTSGSISCMLGANAETVTASSTSGSISLAAAGSIETVKLGSTSGSIAPDLASVGKAGLSSFSGSVEGSISAFHDLKIETTSGPVNVNLPAEPGFTCTVSTSSGSFGSDLALTKDGNNYTCGDGSARCSIGTASGDIRIGKAE